MALSALLAVILVPLPARTWAGTTHLAATGEPGDKLLKAYRHHHSSRVYDFYRRKGYEACHHRHELGWLHLHRRVNCTAAFQDMLAKVELPPRSGSPPRDMPPNMVSEYLIDNQVHLRLTYEGNSIYHGGSEPHDWSAAVVEQFMSRAKKGDGFDYGPSEASTVYQALAEYPVEHLSGLVVGSISPWVEAILLVAGTPFQWLCAGPGAKNLTTVEYSPINSGHERIAALTPRRFAEQWLAGSFRAADFVFTYSSIEHNGLGRYGDPLDPAGDLSDVEMLSCVIKPGGLLYLGVPVGPDAVVFNVHRIYGPMRLSMLTANFKVLNIISPGNMTFEGLMGQDVGGFVQPTIVLQNNRDAPCNF